MNAKLKELEKQEEEFRKKEEELKKKDRVSLDLIPLHLLSL